MNKTLLAAALVIAGTSLFAGDVLRFRGENSQGMFTEEKGLMKSWPQEGLTPKWIYTGLGEGWSSPIKVGNRLFISGSDMSVKKEMVVCLDLDGKIIWQTPTGTRWERAYPGVRSTPTYVPGEKDGEGRLLVTTGSGELFCLNATDGKILWSKAVSSDYNSNFMNWGMAESPVVKDGLVFVTASGSKALVVALKISDGSVAWTANSNNDKLGYVTPVIVKDQLIVMTDGKVNGISIKDGTMMWEDDYRATSNITEYTGNILSSGRTRNLTRITTAPCSLTGNFTVRTWQTTTAETGCAWTGRPARPSMKRPGTTSARALWSMPTECCTSTRRNAARWGCLNPAKNSRSSAVSRSASATRNIGRIPRSATESCTSVTAMRLRHLTSGRNEPEIRKESTTMNALAPRNWTLDKV